MSADTPSPFEHDENGEPTDGARMADVGGVRNGAGVALHWAKYDADAFAYLRFWLDAIEYGALE